VDRTLGAIIEYDATHDTRLLATLKAYFEAGCRNQQCADALEIHVTTLRYRLTRIAELFGLDLESATKRFDVELALRLTDLCRT
jgi:DNA-binding PucR family transcriptional regulator